MKCWGRLCLSIKAGMLDWLHRLHSNQTVLAFCESRSFVDVSNKRKLWCWLMRLFMLNVLLCWRIRAMCSTHPEGKDSEAIDVVLCVREKSSLL